MSDLQTLPPELVELLRADPSAWVTVRVVDGDRLPVVELSEARP